MASSFKEIQSAVTLEPWYLTVLKRVYVVARRSLTIISPLIGVYVIGGSYMFGEWWYGFFWDRGFERGTYLAGGMDYLLASRIVLSIGIVVALFITVVCVVWLKRIVFPFVDRFAWLVLLSVFAAVVIDAFIVRNTMAEGYRMFASLEQVLNSSDATFRKILDLDAPPEIEPPIYFHYLDESRVAGLYNQIEPELEEKQREVTGSATLKGRADVGISGAGVGIEAGSENRRKITLNPPESSPDRKCISVMKYVRDTWPENYFTREGDFYSRKLGEEREQQRKLMIGQPVTKSQLESLRLESPEEIENKVKQLHATLGYELMSVRGLIFVDGEFTKSESGDKIVLVRKFSSKPTYSFRVSLPNQASHSLPTTRPLRLRVFGDVVRPLAKDGYIEVAGISVF